MNAPQTLLSTVSDNSVSHQTAAGDLLHYRVLELVQETDWIRTVVLQSVDGARLPSFTPGSHIVLQCGVQRNAYSLTGPTVEPKTYTVSVLHQPEGSGGSQWIHSDLRAGDILAGSPPISSFPPILSAKNHLLIAGGIGITAMMSHVRSAVQWGRKFTLLYSYKPGGGSHLPELRDLCGPRLVEIHDRHTMQATLQEHLSNQVMGTHVYTCGPASLQDTVRDLALAAGWPTVRIHEERFAMPPLPPGKAFTARLAASGLEVPVPTESSLLEALEGAGVKVPNRCRQGVCGECRLTVLSGSVNHRDIYLTDDERAAGTSIMACASRSNDEILEIDL